MAELLRMPEVAAGASSAVLSQWPTGVGASFSTGDVIAIIETDKAVVDVEAEADGTLVHLIATEGQEVTIGDPIALIAAPGEDVGDVDAVLASLGVDSNSDSSTDAAPPPAPVPASPANDPTPVSTVLAEAPAEVPAAEVTSEAAVPSGRLFVSPIARRLAKEAGIALTGIAGTGPNGRIRRRDVEAAISGAPSAAPASPAPAISSAPASGFVDIPHSRLRRAIANRLVESKTTAPHFYLRGSAQVDRLMALRAEINDGEDVRVSVNDLVIKAVAAAMVRVPAMNVIWTADAIRQFHTVDMAVAIATESGLVTPVLRNVEDMSVRHIAATTKDFAERAHAGGLKQAELEGGSTSVTNLGMFGTEDFDAIINPPHASILAVGAAKEQPIVADGHITVGSVMKVSLSVDHRPVDGATAAEWMREFVSLLENPAKILA
ncbi:MAG: 2-oxo acid dehydrogenase subunit E2 [Actinobacteria bacterium]|nr:2-oxo acid dehydrogenase subunit E2 [Actinomycetota bacterium]